MKTYTLSFGESINHKPEHPERTAKRSLSWDVTFQVWPNRPSMAKSIRMQERGMPSNRHWQPCVPLAGNEGY